MEEEREEVGEEWWEAMASSSPYVSAPVEEPVQGPGADT